MATNKRKVAALAKWMHATFLQCPEAIEYKTCQPWAKLPVKYKRPYLFVAEKMLAHEMLAKFPTP